MQATVRLFDPRTRAGSVLADDGREFAFGPAAFARGGLRLLRSGQRVRVDLTPGSAAEVHSLTVLTLPS